MSVHLPLKLLVRGKLGGLRLWFYETVISGALE